MADMFRFVLGLRLSTGRRLASKNSSSFCQVGQLCVPPVWYEVDQLRYWQDRPSQF